jgi:hypothetical protein
MDCCLEVGRECLGMLRAWCGFVHSIALGGLRRDLLEGLLVLLIGPAC